MGFDDRKLPALLVSGAILGIGFAGALWIASKVSGVPPGTIASTVKIPFLAVVAGLAVVAIYLDRRRHRGK